MPEEELDLDVQNQEEFDNLWVVQALKLVHGDRPAAYGHPYDTYSKARILWLGILGIPVTWEQFCYCMVALKMARELTNPRVMEDNNIDAIGYMAVLNRILLKEEELARIGSDGTDQGPAGEAQDLGEQELSPTEEVPATPRASGGGRGARSRAPKGRARNKGSRSRSRKA